MILDGGVDVDEADFWAWQAPYFEKVASSGDAAEGAQAFVEKRTPQWGRAAGQ